MTKKRKHRQKEKRAKRSIEGLALRRVPDENVFELVHPPCMTERTEDLEEVYAMLDAGEVNLALIELRWLLEECKELLEAHKLLGEIAFADGDLTLARSHFGRAYELGLKAFPKGGPPGPLPYARSPNRAFFEAGRGLARCLAGLGESKLAAEVVGQLLALDPGDPLAVKHLLGRT